MAVLEFEDEPHLLAVAVVEVAALHVLVERKIFGDVRREFEELCVEHAVQRQVPAVVVAVKAHDDVDLAVLQHEPEGRDDRLLFDAFEIAVSHF